MAGNCIPKGPGDYDRESGRYVDNDAHMSGWRRFSSGVVTTKAPRVNKKEEEKNKEVTKSIAKAEQLTLL